MKMPDEFHDHFLIHSKDVTPRLGCTFLDEMKLRGGQSLARKWESVQDAQEQQFKRDPLAFLCQGAAMGLSEKENIAVHYWAGRNLKFIGFLIGQAETGAVIKTRGSVVLLVPGAIEGDRGRSVFCTAPNAFSLSRASGAAEIGQIRYVQNGHCAVAFKRADDEKPLDLSLAP
jgi:hypothetical protein